MLDEKIYNEWTDFISSKKYKEHMKKRKINMRRNSYQYQYFI